MKSSKLSEAWGTGFQADPFVQARWRLTGLYVLILTAVVVLLSLTLYTIHGNQVHEQRDRDLEQARTAVLPPGERGIPEPKLEEYLEALGRSIVLLDVFTIMVAGAFSYWLAGRTLRPIREAIGAEQRFFASAAHDLRTPLAVMKTEIEVALRDPSLSMAEARKTLGSSLEEIDRMAVLAQELLLLGSASSRPSGGPPKEPQDLADLVLTTVERLQTRAKALGVSLEAGSAAPVLVVLDPVALERALANVLENSLKFTPPGGSVRVRLDEARTHVDVTVTDTGAGIAAADLPLVTQPFFRADAARSLPGSGLGLAIVRQILADHKGSLDIISEPGHGTKVRLRFPR